MIPNVQVIVKVFLWFFLLVILSRRLSYRNRIQYYMRISKVYDLVLLAGVELQPRREVHGERLILLLFEPDIFEEPRAFSRG